MRKFHQLAGAAIGFSFALILLGAVVRSTGSGLACPDWPLCYGLWIPTPAKLAAFPDVGYAYEQIMLEWTHRLLAGAIVGPLVFALCVWAFTLRRQVPALAPLMAAAAALVLVEASLGAVTVFESNSPLSVAAHLATALVLFAVLIVTFLTSRGRSGFDTAPERPDTAVWMAAAITLFAALATMASGAVVAKTGAALACGGWPLCGGSLLPDVGDPLVRAHFGHRLLALATVLLLAWLLVAARARRGDAPQFHRDIATAATLALAEVALGAAAALASAAPPWLAVAHQALGVFVFASLTVAAARPIARRPRFARA